MIKTCILLLAIIACSFLSGQNIELPAAQKTGGMPLMEALANRATVRAYDSTEITTQQLSNLLWASFGVNRADGKRTAPSANNKQEMEIYVLLKSGSYVYDPLNNKLNLISTEDLRSQAAPQR